MSISSLISTINMGLLTSLEESENLQENVNTLNNIFSFFILRDILNDPRFFYRCLRSLYGRPNIFLDNGYSVIDIDKAVV